MRQRRDPVTRLAEPGSPQCQVLAVGLVRVQQRSNPTADKLESRTEEPGRGAISMSCERDQGSALNPRFSAAGDPSAAERVPPRDQVGVMACCAQAASGGVAVPLSNEFHRLTPAPVQDKRAG